MRKVKRWDDEPIKWLTKMRWWNDWDRWDDEMIEMEERKKDEKDEKDEKVRTKGDTGWHDSMIFAIFFINEILYSVYLIGF